MLDQTTASAHSLQQTIDHAIDQIETIIIGKRQPVKLAVCCLLAGGHCLIEDLPGVGKTTLSQALARVFGLDFSRIQFTSDLLPADILGVSIFDPNTQSFNFHAGPIFAHCVLADEMNRATPKTQSALLEAMEERQITIDGMTHHLKQPFFVIGTQNPLDQSGTFPLPESQLDRFMMKLNLGYPDQKAERALLSGQSRQHLLQQLAVSVPFDELLQLQTAVDLVHVSEPLLDYVQALITATREAEFFVVGLSPRAALALLRAARAWALMHGRDFVEPGDIKAVFSAISAHRLSVREQHGESVQQLIEQTLQHTAIP